MTEFEAWALVPSEVVKLAAELQGPARRILAALRPALGPEDDVWVHPAGEVWVRTDSLDMKEAAWDDLHGPWKALFPAPCEPAPADGQWIRIKKAAPFGLVHDVPAAIENTLGGPRPLTHALVGGLLTAGLGYGAGRVAETLLPEQYFRRGRLPRTLAALGGLVGAMPGTYWGLNRMRGDDPDLQGWSAWTAPEKQSAAPHLVGMAEKAAEDLSGILAPTIPVDAFNRAVWNDVAQPANPYGSKSPWGSGDQPLTTPPAVAATVSGIVSGASALSNRKEVSPFEVGLAAAGAAGRGMLDGMAFGRTLGLLAGMRPEAQQAMQNLGLWGGAVTGAVNALFRR